jgi:hypothetical protein
LLSEKAKSERSSSFCREKREREREAPKVLHDNEFQVSDMSREFKAAKEQCRESKECEEEEERCWWSEEEQQCS